MPTEEKKQATVAQYRLRYQDVRDGKSKTVELYNFSDGSEEPRYFYTREPRLSGARRSCFVKCRDPKDPASLRRLRAEQEVAWICSPYVAALRNNGMAKTMEGPVIERNDGQGWVQLSSQMVIYEYLPSDLEQFWQQQSETLQEEQLEELRGQILLKLIEGVAHLHQAQLLHRDIKPRNIMVNCQNLCPEAAWPFPELDVKLTDMDGAHDVHVGPPAFYVRSQPFQPDWPLQSSVWVDIYSLCIVAMWLYGKGRTGDVEYEFLRQISSRPLSERELFEVIASANVRLPALFLDCLKPTLETVSQCLGNNNGADAWRKGIDVLYSLRERLHDYYFGTADWRPIELLHPRSHQPLWSAVLHIDRNYWPVLGRGCCYHALSMMDQAWVEESTAAEEEPTRMDSWSNAESLSVYYYKNSVNKGDDCERISSPPEIYLTCEDADGLWGSSRLKASIFGSVRRGSTYENRLFASRKNLSFGEDAVLYDGKPLYILGENRPFLEKVRVRAIRFHEEGEIKPQLVYRDSLRKTGTDVNLVLLVDCWASLRAPSRSVKLLNQIAEEVQIGGPFHPRFYGLAVRRNGKPSQSFCGGRTEMPPGELAALFAKTASGMQIRNELSWDRTQPTNKRYAFDPRLPTIVIACLEQGPECVFAWQKEGCPTGEYSALRWAADYMQVFLPPEAAENLEPWEPLMPQLAAAVRPGGICTVTPFAQDSEQPDPERRWLTAIRHYCGWM